MKPHSSFILFAALIFCAFIHAEEAAPTAQPLWLTKAEDSLVGTWLNTNEKTTSIPKVEIFREGMVLKARFWGRTHPTDTPFGPPEPLMVLSDHSDQPRVSNTHPLATAFATHKADFAMYYLKLTLAGKDLQVETVTIFTDKSNRSNRIIFTSYQKQ